MRDGDRCRACATFHRRTFEVVLCLFRSGPLSHEHGAFLYALCEPNSSHTAWGGWRTVFGGALAQDVRHLPGFARFRTRIDDCALREYEGVSYPSGSRERLPDTGRLLVPNPVQCPACRRFSRRRSTLQSLRTSDERCARYCNPAAPDHLRSDNNRFHRQLRGPGRACTRTHAAVTC